MDDGASLLQPYRVLDLTEGGLNFAGKLLADLGADVIRVEPPFGSATRCRGPFYHDQVHPERSLFWFAFNVNKRGITLDPGTADGAAIFRGLLQSADILLESCPQTMMKCGLDTQSLRELNPCLVHVSVTPFGRNGPYEGYRSNDLITWALSGYLYVCGEPRRPPVRISVPVSEQIAGGCAAAAAMHALWYRNRTGLGQRAEVSQLSAAVWANSMLHGYGVTNTPMQRQGAYRTQGRLKFQELFRCRDGYVTCFLMQGHWGAPFNQQLVAWMQENDMATAELIDLDWSRWLPTTMVRDDDPASITSAERQALMVEEPVAAFLLTKTKSEIFQRALAHSLQIGPVMDVKDISEWPHLKERGFWQPVDHPELSSRLLYPGPFARFSETPVTYRRRPPMIGEHNRELYGESLGYTDEHLRALREAGAI